MHKPFSPACERNQDAILAVLRTQFAERTSVLEIGSGTGQHAVHFAAALPQLVLADLRRAREPARTSAVARRGAAAEHARTRSRSTSTVRALGPLRRGLQRQHPAHHGLARVSDLFALLPADAPRRAADGVRPVQLGGAFTSASKQASTPCCAADRRSAASATSRRSMRWRGPPASR
jgi:hypothetical protein